MATEKDTRQSLLTKIASLASTAPTIKDLAYIAEGSKLLTQTNIDADLVPSQKTARQAIIDKAKTFSDAVTNHKDLGYLSKVMDDYLTKNLENGIFTPFDLTKPYGFINNFANDVWYPIGHRIPVIQEMKKRVVCTGNPMFGGSVYRYLNPTNSAQFEDGTDARAFVAGGALDGSLSTYQVYVETPKFYKVHKRINGMDYYVVGLVPFELKTPDGTLVKSVTDEAFRKSGWTDSGDGTNLANEYDYNYTSAFEGIYFDASETTQKTLSNGNLQTNGVTIDTANDKIISVANLTLLLKPCTYITRANARTLISNATSRQWHWNSYAMDRLLYLTEYGNHNSQAMIGGYTEGGSFSYDKVAPTGTTLSLGNKTGVILNNGSVIPVIAGVSTSAVIGMSYRGVENIFGNIWKWCDGINVNNLIPYVCDINDTYQDNIFAGEYIQKANAMPNVSGYQVRLQKDTFFPQTIGSSSAKDITDYYYQATGQRVVYLGGGLYDGSNAGLSFFSCNNASSNVNAAIGAR